MPTVTMIQKEQAVVGHEFIFLGPSTQCQECKVRGACLNQTDGRRYRVIKIRDVTHDCLLSGDLVRVVEVEPSAPPVCLDLNIAREGSIVTYQAKACDDIICDNFTLCRPRGLENGTRVRVVEVRERLSCAKGYCLVMVIVAYAEDRL